MVEQHPIPSFPAALQQPPREELERAQLLLRAELDAAEVRARAASTAHQLARLSELADDLPGAARDDLEATKRAAGFIEPLESLASLALSSRSSANLERLLERLLAVGQTPEQIERAALHGAFQHLALGDSGAAERLVEAGLERAPKSSALWLARDLLAAAAGDAAARERATSARAELADSSELRALLHERLARAHDRQGRREEALAARLAAAELWPRPEALRQLELSAASAGDLETAAEAALSAAQGEEKHGAESAPAAGQAVATAARLRAALYLAQSDQTERALGLLEDVVESAPLDAAPLDGSAESSIDPALGLALQARLQLRAGDASGAEATLGRALGVLSGDEASELALRASLAALVLVRARSGATDAEPHASAQSALPAGAPASIALAAFALADALRGASHTEAAEVLERLADARSSERGELLLAAALLWLLSGTAERALACVRLAEASGAEAAVARGLLAGILSASAESTMKLEATRLLLEGLPRADRAADGGLREAARAQRAALAWQAVRLLLAEGRAGDAAPLLAEVDRGSAPAALLEALLTRGAALPALAAARYPGLERARQLLALPDEPSLAEDLVASEPRDRLARTAAALALAACVDAGRPADASQRTAAALAEHIVALAEQSEDDVERAGLELRAALTLLAGGGTPPEAGVVQPLAPRASELLRRVLCSTELAELEPWLHRLAGPDAGDGARHVEPALTELAQAFAALAEGLESTLSVLDSPRSPEAALLRLACALAHGRSTFVEALELDALLGRELAPELGRGAGGAAGVLSRAPDLAGGLVYSASCRDASPAERLQGAERWAELSSSPEALLALRVAASAAGALSTARAASDRLLALIGARQEILDAGDDPALAWSAAEKAASEGDLARRSETLEALAARLEPNDPDAPTARLKAGWLALLSGDAARALALLEPLSREFPEESTVWLALECSARQAGRADLEAAACTELARRTESAADAAQLWERAGELFEGALGEVTRAEECYVAALGRRPSSPLAFARLYRIAHAAGDYARLIELIDGRLDGVAEGTRRARLLWDKARYSRRLGRRGVALRALSELLELSPDHLPALALSAELHLLDQRLEPAAEALQAVACHPDTPSAERARAGAFAADLLERLRRPRDALTLLARLEEQGVPREALLEPRARCAALAAEWSVAYRGFLELAEHRDDLEGRLAAARMTLAIQRDHLRERRGLEEAARLVLRDAPEDRDAIDVVLAGGFSREERRRLLDGGRGECLTELRQRPLDPLSIRRLVALCEDCELPALERVALGALDLTGLLTQAQRERHDGLVAAARAWPTAPLPAGALDLIASPGQLGSFARLAELAVPAIARLTVPSLEAFGVAPSMRIDPFARSPQRDETSVWTTLVGVGDHELYLGGSAPDGVLLVWGELPTFVLGSGLSSPLPPVERLRLAYLAFSEAMRVGPLLAMPLGLAEQWLAAAGDVGSGATGGGVEREQRAAALARTLTPEQRAQLGAVVADITRAGGTPADLALAARIGCARLASLIFGSPAALRRLPELLPADASARERVVEGVLRFAFSKQFLDYRQTMGLDL